MLPDGYNLTNVRLHYIIEADKQEEVEESLMNRSLPFLCKQYVFDNKITEFAAVNESDVIAAGKLVRKTKDDADFPDSYKLIPLEGQATMSIQQWTFVLDYISFDPIPVTSLTMDAFFVNLPGRTGNGSGIRSSVWLYHDMTEFVRRAFPDAGVKTVVIAQIIGYK